MPRVACTWAGCTLTYTSRANMERHIARNHTRSANVRCDICGKTCGDHHELKKHRGTSTCLANRREKPDEKGEEEEEDNEAENGEDGEESNGENGELEESEEEEDDEADDGEDIEGEDSVEEEDDETDDGEDTEGEKSEGGEVEREGSLTSTLEDIILEGGEIEGGEDEEGEGYASSQYQEAILENTGMCLTAVLRELGYPYL